VYAQQGYPYQCVGLEFLLEHLSPNLTHPAFTIDGINTLSQWDSEIPHDPLLFVIRNTTRGAAFFSVVLETKRENAAWMELESPNIINWQNTLISISLTHTFCGPIYNGPGGPDHATINLLLQNLPRTGYGKTYQAVLRLMVLTVDQGWSPAYEGRVVISTMEYRQGFRWHLWRWGLRGGLPGLIGNAVAGLALSLIIFLLILHVQYINPSYFVNKVLLASIDGMGDTFTPFPGDKFILITGAVTGILGSVIGWKKGHTHYHETKNAKNYTDAGRTCSLFFILLYWILQYNPFNGLSWGWPLFIQVMESLLTGLLFLLVIYLLFFMRFLIERLLRQRYSELLKPQGSRRS
jgi:hypothetical protein